MPVGIVANAVLFILGGLVGFGLRRYIPAKIISALVSIFGISAIVIGLDLISQLNYLPAVVLALIVGTIIGESLDLEAKIASISRKSKQAVEKILATEEEGEHEYIEKFINLLLLVCTGSAGILGALVEGMTGDYTILLAKSVLDFFTAGIFAASMGIFVVAIALPQFLLFLTLFLLAGFLYPLTTPELIADFTACGGVITLMTGFRMLEIKGFRVSNVLPAMFVIMPIAYFWEIFVNSL